MVQGSFTGYLAVIVDRREALLVMAAVSPSNRCFGYGLRSTYIGQLGIQAQIFTQVSRVSMHVRAHVLSETGS